MNRIIVKLKADKASKINQMFNRMFKVLQKTMTIKLISIF